MPTALRQWQAGDLAGAERTLRALLGREPHHVEAWQGISQIILAQGRREAALGILKEGFAACEAAQLADAIAAWHIRARNPAAARTWLERARTKDVDDPVSRRYQFALCDWLAGDYQAAVEQFARVAAEEPENPHYAARLARALANLGHADKATVCLRRLLPQGMPASSYGLLALCEFDLNGPQAALTVVERGRGEYRDDPLLANLLAALLTLRGNAADIPPAVLTLCEANPQAQARWQSFRYAHSRQPRPVFHGLTSAVLEHGIAASPAAGLVLEFGVYRGLSLSFIAARVAGPVHGFDSFEGLPEAWKPGEQAGSYSARGVLPNMPAEVSLHAGWFKDTVPAFFSAQGGPIRLLHVDCDLFSSTLTVLEQAGDYFVPGTVVVFDEYAGYPGYEDHEFRAWQEFVRARGTRYEYLAFNLTAKKAAVRVIG